MKKLKILGIIIAISFVIVWINLLSPTLKIATGYTAKYLCSYTYLSNIDVENAIRALDFFPIKYISYEINKKEKKVEASLFGFISKQTATYYDMGHQCGCVLGTEPPKLHSPSKSKINNESKPSDSLTWPRGELLSDQGLVSSTVQKLDKILEKTIQEHKDVFAIVVANDSTMLAEQYQSGVDKDSRLLGWSMTKTVGNALFGVLEKNQRIDVNQNQLLPEWENDSRKKITLNNLLQMSSGLEWTEDYSKLSDVTRMLYLDADFPSRAIRSPSVEAPDQRWYYSSGTSNILSQIMRNSFNDDSQYSTFPYKSLFGRINMRSAVIETDNAGNFVLSSYCWATARDWTKLGMLYLNRGNWFGDPIFPPYWVNYSTIAARNSDGQYGAQIWLNQAGKYSSVPREAYYADGYGGQRVLIVPSKNLVITVLSGRQDNFDFNRFFQSVIACLEEQ